MKQILHVKGIDSVFGVILDHLVGYQDGFGGIRSAEAIEREATRKTSNRTEQTFEGLRHVMRHEILVYLTVGSGMKSSYKLRTYLHHCNDGLLSIGQLSLAASTDELLVVYHPVRLG